VIATRPYNATDRVACMAVFYRAVREGAVHLYTPEQCAAWAPTAMPDLSLPDKLLEQWCHVSVEGGAITGFMSLRPDGYLDMAFVLPEVMGKGHSAALYDALLRHAQQAGMGRLWLHASHFARRFFGRRGWQVDRAEVVEIRGQSLTRFQMSLELSPSLAEGGPDA
jgi:putative acetyltransferase